MKTIEKIRQKIEELYDGEAPAHAQQCDFEDGYFTGIGAISKFLDSLESEKPMDPNNAMKELNEKIALVKQRGTWDGVDVDKYMDEVRGREPEKPMNQDDELNDEIKRFVAEYGYERGNDILLIAIVARHFAEWQKNQMLKEAVSVEVVGDKRDLRLIDSTQRCLFNANRGDWLKIIIVKED